MRNQVNPMRTLRGGEFQNRREAEGAHRLILFTQIDVSFPFLSFPFLSFPFLSFPFLSFPLLLSAICWSFKLRDDRLRPTQFSVFYPSIRRVTEQSSAGYVTGLRQDPPHVRSNNVVVVARKQKQPGIILPFGASTSNTVRENDIESIHV